MSIPPKYEDVVAKLDAALAREDALREDRDQYQRIYNRASIGLCAIGEVVGVPEEDQSTSAVIDALTALMAECDALQQRLTVAEQREGDLREKLAYEESDHHTKQVSRDAWRAKYEDALRVIQEKDLLLNRSKNFVAFVHKCVRKNKEYAPLHWQEMVELDRDLSALEPAAECGHGYSNPTGCPICQGIKP